MPKLTITSLVAVPTGYPAYQLSPLQVQDPFPAEGRLVIEVAPSDTISTEVNMDQLMRIRSQLVDLETRGEITWSVLMTTEDRRGEESDLMGDTAITYLDTGVTPMTGGAVITGAAILGTKLLMGYVQAEMTMLDPANAADWLTLQAVDTGADSNLIGIQLISDAGVVDPSNIEYAEPTTLPSGYTRVLELHILPATFTWATLAVILNDVVNGIIPRTSAFPLGSYRIFCSIAGAGSGADPIDQALAPLTGGTGSALGLVIGDTPANITLHTNTLITYDVDLSAGSTMVTTDTAVVRLRATSGGPSVSASIVIA